MTVRELADASGVSPSMISQAERGIATPSIESLRRLASGLRVSVFQLADDADDQPSISVVKADRRRRVVVHEDQITYELLSPHAKGALEIWIGRLRSGSTSGAEPSSHPSEEFILVQEGEMEIDVGGETYKLGSGDAIQYDGSVPHLIRATGDEDLVFLSALTPPTL